MNRINKAVCLLNKIDADALILKDESNMHYFCNFSPSEGTVLIFKDGTGYHFVDSRYTETAQINAKESGLIVIEWQRNLVDEINDKLISHGAKSVAFENDTISLKQYILLTSKIKIEFVALNDELAKIRNIKDDEEIVLMKKAQSIAEKAYTELLNFIKVGKTEKELSSQFDYLMAQYGSDGVSFDTILLTGTHTSMPHGVPSDKKIGSGDFVLMDFGATYKGYHSDTTRTVAVDSATDEMKEMYYLVLKAQEAGINAINPNEKCSDVYFAAKNVLDEKDMGKYFRHSLGHGVGLDIHEIFSSSPFNDEVYQIGNVSTIEPGIYLPDKFGIRIEDVIYLGKNGKDNLVTLNKELIIL